MAKKILYYSHNSLPIEMEEFFQRKLVEAANGIPIVSVIKNPRTEYAGSFGNVNLVDTIKVSNWESIRRQMKMGLEQMQPDDIVYLAEHDVLYPSSYFDEIPDDNITFLKNKKLYFLTRRGYLGPHNTHIHSQTIGAASLFLHCIDEDVPAHKKFKSGDGYTLTLYNAKDPSLDVRHGANWTGDRGREASKYIQELPFWGNWKDVGNSIPGFEARK